MEEPKLELHGDNPTDASIKEIPSKETPLQAARVHESPAASQDSKETVGQAGEEPVSSDGGDPVKEDTVDNNDSKVDLDCPDDLDTVTGSLHELTTGTRTRSTDISIILSLA
jgi:hypothetical protein